MLKSLTIQNYAIIRDLQINFSGGLTIITGETGAGKSILLGALTLLTGQRADSGVLFDASRKCFVEGSFDIKNYGLEELYTRNELEPDEILIIRREISADGKSRAFINDTPVNASVLKEFGERLIDIHSQHQNIYLDNPVFQLNILDTFAQQTELVNQYKEQYSVYKSLTSQYSRLQEDFLKNKSELEYILFQYNQLAEAKLTDGELESLEEEHKTLTHAEEIKTQLLFAANNLNNEERSAVLLLKDTLNALNKIKNVFGPSSDYLSRLESAFIEIKDISSEIEEACEKIEFNPDRARLVKERIDLIYSLLQKHRVSKEVELIEIKNRLKENIDTVENSDTALESLKLDISKVQANLENKAATLSKKRKETIPGIENKIQELLLQLGMPHGIFKIELTTLNELTNNGTDKIRFLFSGNKQSTPQEIGKIASGGEMARLMLSLKAVVAGQIILPTILFDEIDQGVSGDIADKMGNVILNISKTAQVINITHLPQIASKGANHFLVYKKDLGDSTQTQIKQLQSDDRVIEIARMLSGEQLSEAAINNAKALLGI
jgi:DNA repair protein RecN (Recombination protein N)